MKRERTVYWAKIISARDSSILWMSRACRTRHDAEYELKNALDVFDFPEHRYQKIVSSTYTFEDTPPSWAVK